MKIIVLEDDYLQAEWLEKTLITQFPTARVTRLNTEYEFRRELPEIAQDPPALFLLDVMCRWTDASPKMPSRPEDAKKGGYYRAGLRCEKLIRAEPATANVPVILYTVLDNQDLADEIPQLVSHTVYVGKNSDPTSLFDKIQELTALKWGS